MTLRRENIAVRLIAFAALAMASWLAIGSAEACHKQVTAIEKASGQSQLNELQPDQSRLGTTGTTKQHLHHTAARKNADISGQHVRRSLVLCYAACIKKAASECCGSCAASSTSVTQPPRRPELVSVPGDSKRQLAIWSADVLTSAVQQVNFKTGPPGFQRVAVAKPRSKLIEISRRLRI